MPKFTDLLADTPADIQKFAAIESPDRESVEEDFGRLAFAFLRDRASALLPYLVGFEIVEQEPDGSKAVGLFGFSINKSFWYVPAFFMRNQIKGMDMLYSKDQSSFVPLRESWINHILSRKTVELGAPADKDVRKDLSQPDFKFLATPPVGSGAGSGFGAKAAEFLKDACAIWNKLQEDVIEQMDKDADFREALAGSLAKLGKQAVVREKKASTPLIRFLKQSGGPQAVATVLKTFENTGFLKAACAFYDHHDLMINTFSEALAPKIAQQKVKIVTEEEVRDDRGGAVPTVSDSYRKRIVRDSFTMVDQRSKEERSEVYKTDYLTCMGNPNDSGKCLVIMRGGAQVPMYVLVNPYRAYYDNMAIAIDLSTGRYFKSAIKAIFTKLVAEDAEAGAQDNELFAQGVPVGDMEVGQMYILVNSKLSSSMPFRVKASVSEDDDLVRLKIKWVDDSNDWVGKRPESPSNKNNEDYRFDTWDDSDLLPIDKAGKLNKTGNDLIVPSRSWKAFKLQQRKQDGNGNMSSRDGEGSSFVPASMGDINEMMTKESVHRLRVTSDGGSEYTILLDGLVDQHQLGYKSATVRLVRDYGLTPDETEELLKEAQSLYKAARLVKFAQVSMPMPQPPGPGFEALTDVQTTEPFATEQLGQTFGTPPPNQNTGPGSGFNLGGDTANQLGQNVTGLAEQAAATGQQQVFDHGVIGGLAGMYDTSNAIDSYMPEMMKALDRVGRILFLFYWKNTDFAERYGNQDLAEMEDHLRAVFKSLGDLILSLRQRTIDAEESEFIQAD